MVSYLQLNKQSNYIFYNISLSLNNFKFISKFDLLFQFVKNTIIFKIYRQVILDGHKLVSFCCTEQNISLSLKEWNSMTKTMCLVVNLMADKHLCYHIRPSVLIYLIYFSKEMVYFFFYKLIFTILSYIKYQKSNANKT